MSPAADPKGIDELIAEGEEAIASASSAPAKKRVRKSAEEKQKEKESKEQRDARLAMMSITFGLTGRIVFNDLLRLEPRFSEEAGKALAEAWLPVLDSYVESPLGIALTVTGGVCAPYLLQLIARNQRAAAERAAQGATGREIRAAS